jgi:hypothetical protein
LKRTLKHWTEANSSPLWSRYLSAKAPGTRRRLRTRASTLPGTPPASAVAWPPTPAGTPRRRGPGNELLLLQSHRTYLVDTATPHPRPSTTGASTRSPIGNRTRKNRRHIRPRDGFLDWRKTRHSSTPLSPPQSISKKLSALGAKPPALWPRMDIG